MKTATSSGLRRTLSDISISLAVRIIPVAAILLGLMAVAIFRFGTLSNATAALRGETLVIRPLIRSFGIARPGQEVSVEFSVTNLGSIPTRLLGSRTACICTVPERLPKTLNSRETHVFRVMLHIPDKAPVSPQDAEFRQEVVLYTSDPSHPQVTLAIEGEVR